VTRAGSRAEPTRWTYDEYARLPDDGDPGVEAAPGLVVEVISPGSESVDRGKKPGRYAEHGVPDCLI